MDLMITFESTTGMKQTAFTDETSWGITKEIAVNSGGSVTVEQKENGYNEVATVINDDAILTYKRYVCTGN